MDKVMFSSASDEWATPQDFFDKLNEEFGFTLDPCANAENHKCDKYFTKEQNGLVQEWGTERVYCNPPYGRGIGEWVAKCSRHRGLAVMLIPARTDTKWFHEYVYQKLNVEIRFVRGRLKFSNSSNSAPFPSMVIVFNKEAG